MPRVILFANGELPEPAEARRLIQPDDLIIAADGGARHCQTLGLQPQLVVGDFDSLPAAALAALEQSGARLERHPRQKNDTDLELALRAALRAGASEGLLLGALGGRWDQTLANLLLLAHPDFAPLNVRAVAGRDTLWVVRQHAVVAGTPGDTLSLLPLDGDAQGVTLTGLEYPLVDEPLRFGLTRGLSNVFVLPEATITVRRGLLLAVHTRR